MPCLNDKGKDRACPVSTALSQLIIKTMAKPPKKTTVNKPGAELPGKVSGRKPGNSSKRTTKRNK